MTLRGEIDLESATAFDTMFLDLASAGVRDLILDFSALDFMDSVGLGVLVHARRQLVAEGGRFKVVCAENQVRALLRLSAVESLMAAHDSVETALETN